MAQGQGPCKVLRRSHIESLKKGIMNTTYSVTLKSPDGHTHVLVSPSRTLWDEYPFGSEREVSIEKTQQTTLAVDKMRAEE